MTRKVNNNSFAQNFNGENIVVLAKDILNKNKLSDYIVDESSHDLIISLNINSANSGFYIHLFPDSIIFMLLYIDNNEISFLPEMFNSESEIETLIIDYLSGNYMFALDYRGILKILLWDNPLFERLNLVNSENRNHLTKGTRWLA
jgi:hypothetical protein